MFNSIRLSTALLALAATPSAQASQSFSNRGTLDGWAGTNEEHNGSVEEVSDTTYEGDSALQMTQIYDPNYDDRYHSEVYVEDAYQAGSDGFYGFAFRLQPDWEFTEQSYNLAQFIADFSDTGCDDYMPSSMVWLIGDRLQTRVKSGSVCDQQDTEFADLATVSPGAWHRVVIQASWQSDPSGFYKLWLDGDKVLERFNLSTTVDDDRPFQFRVGLYANGWYDDGGMEGSQGTRSVWYDEIAMGTEFADADPDQW